MEAGLYIVGTPIGNLGDMSPRALEVLGAADVILAEDTRHTRRLLTHFDIHVPLESHHKFNEASRVAAAVDRLRGGQVVALVTDSGMPAVSDPGSRLVDACHEAGVPVVVVPGPSAVTAAVALSGFAGSGFVFEGFLPPKAGARGRRLEELLRERRPVVLFESPHRLVRMLGQVGELAPEARLCIAREMTKKFEECLRGTPAELLERIGGRTVRGEIVVVIAPDRCRWAVDT